MLVLWCCSFLNNHMVHWYTRLLQDVYVFIDKIIKTPGTVMHELYKSNKSVHRYLPNYLENRMKVKTEKKNINGHGFANEYR